MKKWNFEKLVEKSIEIYGDKFIIYKENYKSTKVKFKCKICDNDFFRTASYHILKNKDCPFCSGSRLCTKSYVVKAENIHNKENIIYDYRLVEYIHFTKKIKIICKICNKTFEQNANNHLNGEGCPTCGINSRINLTTKTTKEFKNECFLLYGNDFEYLSEYIGCFKKIKIRCVKHDLIFEQEPNSHLRGNGCDLCTKEAILKANSYDNESYFKLVAKIFNNKYEYFNDYIGCYDNIKVNCPIKDHGIFYIKAYRHVYGYECPKCNKSFYKMESSWLDSLNILQENRQYKLSIKNKQFRADGYDPNTNTVYEFYGDYWHGNPSIYNQNDIHPKIPNKTYKDIYDETINRENIIKEAGYNLIVIWEKDYKKQLKLNNKNEK